MCLYCFCRGTLFNFKTSQSGFLSKQNVRQHILIQSLSSICAHIPHLEYSGGQSFTSVRIHVITCAREQAVQDHVDFSTSFLER